MRVEALSSAVRPNQRRLIVLGAGAIGGTVGARLAEAGHDVVLIARGAHFEAIQRYGLRLDASDGTVTIPIAVVDTPAAITWRPSDVVLLAVKTQHAAAALGELAHHAPTATPIACLTNGLEAERLALRWFRDVHAVYVMSPASFMTPGAVEQWSSPLRGVLDVGGYPDGASAIDDELASAFRAAGFASEARKDVMRWKRRKLLDNLANAIEALAGRGDGWGELATKAAHEGSACFDAAGLACTSDAEQEARRTGVNIGEIAGATRAGGSTWQSLARGHSDVECDYLNGEIVLLGRLHGVPTPINERLQRLIADAAQSGKSPGAITLDDLLAC